MLFLVSRIKFVPFFVFFLLSDTWDASVVEVVYMHGNIKSTNLAWNSKKNFINNLFIFPHNFHATLVLISSKNYPRFKTFFFVCIASTLMPLIALRTLSFSASTQWNVHCTKKKEKEEASKKKFLCKQFWGTFFSAAAYESIVITSLHSSQLSIELKFRMFNVYFSIKRRSSNAVNLSAEI